ncbi:hypothetical protein [Nostoc sp. NZL]|uniref:hypothetical protein n=1 Tax=Nostoc sp. NZL TaxID=2650612 RepID=UPI0018C69701|nr:hypothetical protein [Nostoc sp. NZL]
MTVIVAKWRIDEYHRMIDAGILSDGVTARRRRSQSGTTLGRNHINSTHSPNAVSKIPRCDRSPVLRLPIFHFSSPSSFNPVEEAEQILAMPPPLLVLFWST